MVLLNLDLGKYFALDAVGASIWDDLAKGKTLDEVATNLLTQYDVDGARARADVKRLAEDLLAAGLLEPA